MTIIDQFIPERRQGIIEESPYGLLAVCTPSVIHIFTSRDGKPHSYISYAAMKTDTKERNFHATESSDLGALLSTIILHGNTEGFRSILWMENTLLVLLSTGRLCCMSMKCHVEGWQPVELPHLPTSNVKYICMAYDECSKTLVMSCGMGTLLFYYPHSHVVQEYSIDKSRILWMRFSSTMGGLLCITENGEIILTNARTGKCLWSHADGILQPVGFMELDGRAYLTKFNRVYALDGDFNINVMSLDDDVDLPVAGLIPDVDGKNPVVVTSDARLFKVDFGHNTVTPIHGLAPWKRSGVLNGGDRDDKSDDEDDDESAPSTPTTPQASSQTEVDGDSSSKKITFVSTIRNNRVWIIEAEQSQYPMPDRALLYQHRLSAFDHVKDAHINAVNAVNLEKVGEDSCPTCQRPVKVQSNKFAICESGHVFDVCPMHAHIIKDALKARKCLGCGIVACPSDSRCPCGSILLPIV